MNTRHRRKIDHHAAVGRRTSRHIVTTPADGDLELLIARQSYRIDYVAYATAPRDERRALIDQPIVDPSCMFIVGISYLEQLSTEVRGEIDRSFGKWWCSAHDASLSLSRSYRANPQPPN
jgi:hypothetical protein